MTDKSDGLKQTMPGVPREWVERLVTSDDVTDTLVGAPSGGAGNNISLGEWNLFATTLGLPSAGDMRADDPTFAGTSNLRVHITPSVGTTYSLEVFDSMVGGFLYVQDVTDPTTNSSLYRIDSITAGLGTNIREIDLTHISTTGDANWTTSRNYTFVWLHGESPLIQIQLSSDTTITTTSATYVDTTGLFFVAPTPGTYLFSVTVNLSHSLVGETIDFQGFEIESDFSTGVAAANEYTWTSDTADGEDVITFVGSMTIDATHPHFSIRWKTSAATATVTSRFAYIARTS